MQIQYSNTFIIPTLATAVKWSITGTDIDQLLNIHHV